MGSADQKKTKRRRNKRATKISSVSTVPTGQVVSPDPPPLRSEFVQQHEIDEIQKLMDAEDDHEPSAAPFSKGPNPYLGGDRCLLCHCERPEYTRHADGHDCEEGAISGLPLWVCQECRKTVEEEEKKASMSGLLDQDFLRVDPASLSLITELPDPNGEGPAAMCSCDACTERRWVEGPYDYSHIQWREIELETENETQELQKVWMEMKKIIRCIYRDTHSQGDQSENRQIVASTLPQHDQVIDMVHRLVLQDPHQFYQRLESQAQEYVIEVRGRLLKQMSTGLKTPQQARQFVAMLLEEYSHLCKAAKTQAAYLHELEQEHLKRFKLTWELLNKHLFHSTIYSDPMLLNKLPLLMAHLRFGSKDTNDDTYTTVLHGYCTFDDEMSVVSVVWRDCFQLIDSYNDEQDSFIPQSTMRAKQKMLREDWEFFKAQRKILEDSVNRNKSPTTATVMESHFTETMRHILQGTKPSADECLCPNCNRKRCPCDECSISHMITCGIINPDIDQFQVHNPLLFAHDPTRYIIDVTPPSMSSTSSSTGSESPITGERENEMEEIVEEIDIQYGDSDSDSNNGDKSGCQGERGSGDGAPDHQENQYYDDDIDDESDDDDEDDDCDDDDDDEDDDDENDSDDDENDEDGDDDDEDEDEDTSQIQEIKDITEVSGFQFPTFTSDASKTDNCDCNHCTQAKLEQARLSDTPVETQCQCHACLQQCSKALTSSFPQHLPAAPRPAALHLYPHIHGSHSIHPGIHAASQLQPNIMPHLYQLHNNPLSIATSHHCVPNDKSYSLDADVLSEHIYHTYRDWGHTNYDATKLMLTSHKFDVTVGGDIFSSPAKPPLSGMPFVAELSGVSTSMENPLANIVKTSTILQQLPATSKPATTTMVTTATCPVASLGGPNSSTHTCASNTENYLRNVKPISHSMFTQALSAQAHAGSNQAHIQAQGSMLPAHILASSACSLNTGPLSSSCSHVASSAALSKSSSNSFSSLATSVVTSTAFGPMSAAQNEFCHKRNYLHSQPFGSGIGSHALGVLGHGQQTPLAHSPSLKLKSELLCSAAKGDAIKTLGAQNLNMFNLPHTCNLSNTQLSSTGKTTNASVPNSQPASTTPSTRASREAGAASTNNNVSVGTSAPCQDGECEGHGAAPEDNYDSIDDSCSEQSSSTSNSNQKDGKYCDCCYCEFFGHTTSQTLPTSRNFTEMREKLRLKLKKKNEAKGDDCVAEEEPELPPPAEVAPTPPDPLKEKGLDELLRFINGNLEKNNEQAPKSAEAKLNSKAAKRARQKQRKLEEKSRREKEQKAREEKAKEPKPSHDKTSPSLKKKRSKHKDSEIKSSTSVSSCLNHSTTKTIISQQSSNLHCMASHQSTSPASSKCIANVPTCCIHTSVSQPSHNKPLESKGLDFKTKEGEKHENSGRAAEKKKPAKSHGSSEDVLKNIKKGKQANGTVQSQLSASQQVLQCQPKQNIQTLLNHLSKRQLVQETVNAKNNQKNLEHQIKNNQTKSILPQPNGSQKREINHNVPLSSAQSNLTVKLSDPPSVTSTQMTASGKRTKVNKKVAPPPIICTQMNGLASSMKCTSQIPVTNTARHAMSTTSVNHVQNTKPAPNVAQNALSNGSKFKVKTQAEVPEKMVNGRSTPNKEPKQEKRNAAKTGTPNEPPRMPEAQAKGLSSKPKKNKRKTKNLDDLDEIFMPKEDTDHGDLDEYEREIEEFKRFCMDSTPVDKKEKLQVNVNLKDIFSKKKSGLGCA